MTYTVECPKGTLRVSDMDYSLKKPTLSIQKKNSIHKIASFNSKETMFMFLQMFGWESEK